LGLAGSLDDRAIVGWGGSFVQRRILSDAPVVELSVEMKGGELEGKRVFGNLWVVEFDAGRPVDAASRAVAVAGIVVVGFVVGFGAAARGNGIAGGTGGGVRIDVGNNRKKTAGPDPDFFDRNLEGGVDSFSEKGLKLDLGIVALAIGIAGGGRVVVVVVGLGTGRAAFVLFVAAAMVVRRIIVAASIDTRR